MRVRRAFPSAATGVLRGLASTSLELARIGRELVAIPVQLWLAVAELAGVAVLAAWGQLARAALYAYDRALDVLELAERHVRPAHGALAVAVAAALALGGSQLLDYRGVAVGAPAYAEVETVAPAPEVDRQRPGSAHGWAAFPIAIAALAAIAIAARGRWRTARFLVPLGAAVIAISVAVDAPRGLDEGGVAIAYEGAEAVLLEGFWAQLVAGAVLAFSGPLLASRLRPRPEAAAPGADQRRRPVAGSRRMAESPMGVETAGPPSARTTRIGRRSPEGTNP